MPSADPLTRIANVLEAWWQRETAPPRDKARERIAQMEEWLGNPIKGVDAEQWAKLAKGARQAIRLLRKVT